VNHFILLTYILHLSFGVAGVASMALLHHRLRRTITAALLWIMSCLLASVFLTMLQYYLFSNLPGSTGYRYLQYALGLAIALALYGGVLFLLLRLPKVPKPAALAMTIFVAAVQLGRVLVLLIGSPEAAALFRAPAVALISLYLFFLGWMLYRAAAAEREESVSLLLRRLGILTLIFAPASTVFYIVTYQVPAVERLHISLDFIYFSLWSIIVIASFLRYLARPTALLEEGKVSPAFLSSYKITKRETEIVELISRGLSNQEIADRLCVSLTTARTHIYNIFRKTGAGSRVELLRILSGYRS
jgi:DNA-binding CsgD family transcriptional regulator